MPAAKYESDPSGLLFNYSGANGLLETRENHFTSVGQNQREFTNSVDGTTVHAERIEEPEVTAQGFSWSAFNDCLASQGIASRTITAISIACAAGAAATIVACIFGLSIISSEVVGYCTGQAITQIDATGRGTDWVSAADPV